MRKLTCKDWSGSHPGTNVLWLLYLTDLLLNTEKPVPGESTTHAVSGLLPACLLTLTVCLNVHLQG